MTLAFFLLAGLLTLAVVLLLVRALWRGGKAAARTTHGSANTAVHRDQLAELERDRASGILSDADFEQARLELQRRVLEEAAPADEPARRAAPVARPAAISLAIVLPLAAMVTYFVPGTPQSLLPQAQQRPQFTSAEIETMVNSLAERLKKSPDDHKGWAMLARSYRAMGRYGESAQAYAKAGQVVEQNSDLLAEHAEVLAMTQNDLAGKPTELLDKALRLNPDNNHALVLSGTAAYERADYAVAIAHWERLLSKLPEDSEGAAALRASIEDAKSERIKARTG